MFGYDTIYNKILSINKPAVVCTNVGFHVISSSVFITFSFLQDLSNDLLNDPIHPGFCQTSLLAEPKYLISLFRYQHGIADSSRHRALVLIEPDESLIPFGKIRFSFSKASIRVTHMITSFLFI